MSGPPAQSERKREGERRPPEELRAGPIGGQLWAVARGLLLRLRLPALAQRYDSTVVLSAFSFINGCISIALMAAVALVSRQPFVFPSLGPTASSSSTRRSRPRRVRATRSSAISSAWRRAGRASPRSTCCTRRRR